MAARNREASSKVGSGRAKPRGTLQTSIPRSHNISTFHEQVPVLNTSAILSPYEQVRRLISAVSMETSPISPAGSAGKHNICLSDAANGALLPEIPLPAYNSSTPSSTGTIQHGDGEQQRIQEYIVQTKEVLSVLNDQSIKPAERLLSVRQMAMRGGRIVPYMLYNDVVSACSDSLLQELDDSAFGQLEREQLQNLIEQGMQLISRLPMEQALPLIHTVHRESRTSPLASVLYLQMLLGATHSPPYPSATRENSPMASRRSSRLGSPSPRPRTGASDAEQVSRSSVSGSPRFPKGPTSPLQMKTALREELRRSLADCRFELRRIIAGPSCSLGEARDIITLTQQLSAESSPSEDTSDPTTTDSQSVPNDVPRLTSTDRQWADNLVLEVLQEVIDSSGDASLPHLQNRKMKARATSGLQVSPMGTLRKSGPKRSTHTSMSHRTDLSDPSSINLVQKNSGARASCDNRVPDLGRRLSKQFEALQLRTTILRQRIHYLDDANNDPFKVGSRAWRFAKRAPRLPPLSVSIDDTRANDSYAMSASPTGVMSPASSPKGAKSPMSPTPKGVSQTVRAAKSTSSPSFSAPFRRINTEEDRVNLTDDELAFLNDLVLNPKAVLAILCIQRRVRGILDRSRYRKIAAEKNTALVMIRNYRRLKQSQINILFRIVRARNKVTKALTSESDKTEAILSALERKEKEHLAMISKKADEEHLELKEAEMNAYRELAEADLAQELMDKERKEMELWRGRAIRAWETYADIKSEYHVDDSVNDEDEDFMRTNHPEVFRARKHAKVIQERFDKENKEYLKAFEDLVHEREEADAAILKSETEQAEWQEANERAREEQALVEAYALARKFTDPRVSIKERFRALSGSNAEAEREVQAVEEGKCRLDGRAIKNLGIMHGVTEQCKYAGEFHVIEDVDEATVRAAFEAACDKAECLTTETLIKAMENVGRRLNDSEAKRLVTSFDNNSDGVIDFKEFVEGLSRMIGMELPHGLGVETYNVYDPTYVPCDDNAVDVPGHNHHHMASYEGEIFEDKRYGIGRYTSPHGNWYMGEWALGVRHGKGFEGVSIHGDPVPLAIVTCVHGKRTQVDWFSLQNPGHRSMLRRMASVVDTAQKRAEKARRVVDEQRKERESLGGSAANSALERHRPPALLINKPPVGTEKVGGMQRASSTRQPSSPEERLAKAREMMSQDSFKVSLSTTAE